MPADATTLVLVHGFMQDARTWDDVVDGLPSGMNAIAPSLDPVDSEHATLDDLAEQVRMAVGDRVPAVFVGYSMGGRVMQAYMRRYPETIRALVLESSGLGPETENERRAMCRRNAEWAQVFGNAMDSKEAAIWWEGLPLFATEKTLSSRVQEDAHLMRLSCNPDHLAWLTVSAGAHTMPLASQTRRDLEALPCPVFYFFGTKDAKYSRTAEALKGGSIVLEAFNTGHDVHLEDPWEYVERLSSALYSSTENDTASTGIAERKE